MKVNKLGKVSELKKLALADVKALYSEFNSSPLGLSIAQWQKNYKKYGPNRFKLEQEIAPFLQFLKLFFSPLSILLLVLSLASYLTGKKAGRL